MDYGGVLIDWLIDWLTDVGGENVRLHAANENANTQKSDPRKNCNNSGGIFGIGQQAEESEDNDIQEARVLT